MQNHFSSQCRNQIKKAHKLQLKLTQVNIFTADILTLKQSEYDEKC